MRQKRAWLHGAVGYEIYTRSFQDTTGDGFGDLAGITERLDYLAWLGIDLVWLTPIFPSPDHDHGYDVADYLSVREAHGTLADVEALLEKAHSLDLKVLLDIVPNHTSSEHEWFKKALADPSSPERKMYLFRDPAPDGGPPNNWVSHFGGPAWTLDEASGQYYCHLFLPEQPDLDWRNPDVLDAFDDIYRFWFEKGVDGFRIDVAHGLLKHPDFPDIPQIEAVADDAGPLAVFFSYDHKYDMDQDDNIEIFGRWQAVADEYDATLLAECGVEDLHRLARYVGPDALDLSFYLRPGFEGWNPEWLVQNHLDLAEIEPDGISWIICNHDQPRVVSRYAPDGDLERGRHRALAMTTFQMALGGVPFLYYGEELGLPSADVDPDGRMDPIATRNENEGGEGRDVARTPMSWDVSPNNGFSAAPPWISSSGRPFEHTVEGQRNDPKAPVHRYRALLDVRRNHPALYDEPLERLDAPDTTTAVVRRGSALVVANLGSSAVDVQIPTDVSEWSSVFVSRPATDVSVGHGVVRVPAETSVILAAIS